MRHIWICLPVAWCYPALAQSLPARVGEALQNNLEILAAQKPYEAARQSATPLPDGGLGASPTSNAGIAISQEVPFPDKRKLRGEEANLALESSKAGYETGPLDALSVPTNFVTVVD